MSRPNYRQIENESIPAGLFQSSSLDRYYQVLGCSSSDSIQTIKSQYRQLVLKYHPDRLVVHGLAPEFARLSSKRFREIQEAYDQISKTRRAR